MSLCFFTWPGATLAGEVASAQWPLRIDEARVWPNEFIDEAAIFSGAMPPGGHLSAATASWQLNRIPELSGGIGFAGYWRDLPDLKPGPYELALDFATSAYEAVLFPRGFPERAIRFAAGRPGKDAAAEIPFLKRKFINFQVAPGETWVLVLNISNFHRTYGGFWEAPKITAGRELSAHAGLWNDLNFAIAGAMVVVMLYAFTLFVRRRSDHPAMFLALTCLATFLRFIGIENLLSAFTDQVRSDLIFQVTTRIEYLSMALVTYAFLEFLRRTFALVHVPRLTYRVLHACSFLLILSTLIFEPLTFTKWVGLFQFNVLIHVFVMIAITFKAIRFKEEGARYVLASATIPLLAGVVDVILSRSGSALYLSHFGGAIFIFMQSQILAKRSANAFQRAEHLSNNLQDEVVVQTLQLRNLMDNVPEGIFTIGKDLRIKGQYSAYVNVVFPDAALHNLHDLLIYNTAIDRSTLDMASSILASVIGEDPIAWELNGDQIFTEVETQGQRFLNFQWHPIVRGELVAEMLIIVRDATELRDLRQRSRHQDQEMVLISALAKAKSYRFQSFMEQANDIVKTIQKVWGMNSASEDQSFIRLVLALLHTLKGDSRQLGFTQLAKDVHGFEQNIVDLRETHGEQGADFSLVLEEGLLSLAANLEMIESLHKRYWDDPENSKVKLVLRDEDIPQIQAFIDGRTSDPGFVKRILRECLLLSFTRRWEGLQAELIRVAHEVGKSSPRFHLELPPDLWLSVEFQMGLINVFGHILRNAVDHGIETPRLRVEANKDMRGRINLIGVWQDDALQITIEDDGRGIDVDGLARKTNSEFTMSIEKKIDLIFSPGLSTASSLSEISGRGIGMDAVKLEIEGLGGTIKALARADYAEDARPKFVPFRLIISFPKNLFFP